MVDPVDKKEDRADTHPKTKLASQRESIKRKHSLSISRRTFFLSRSAFQSPSNHEFGELRYLAIRFTLLECLGKRL